MRFQFTIARMLRSTAFFAVALGVILWMWRMGSDRLANRPDSDRFVCGVFMVPAALGGAIGALFGKTPLGAFLGLVSVVLVPCVMILLAAIAGLVYGL